jgi:tRNA(Ile)-lysidine synthase TilS/MesJ
MYLLDMFLKTGLNIIVAHFNHKLRDKESDEDEDFVTRFSSVNNLKLEK